MSLSLLTTTETSQAAGNAHATFIVPANDGYGVGDCGEGSGCGKVVADAWCEAQGFARSETFGLADPTDVTGAVTGVTSSRPISITCAE